ncbi:hypothetical protein QJQ45_022708, partial [Haematococcus lacustris]
MQARFVSGLLLVSVAVFSVASATVPRGVAPDKADLYSGAGGVFTCLDSSVTIPYSRVNDNYCDCPTDGSDEPGTAACYHGSFYCANRGYEPQQLSASFVDDGVCDCCDGSDEARGRCKNTCLDKSSSQKQAIKDRVAQISQSLDRKTDLQAQAIQLKANWAGKAHSIRSELEAQEAEVQRLQAAKDSADAAAADERAQMAAQELARQAEADEAARAAAAAGQAGAAGGGEAQPDLDAGGGLESADMRQLTLGQRLPLCCAEQRSAASTPAVTQSQMLLPACRLLLLHLLLSPRQALTAGPSAAAQVILPGDSKPVLLIRSVLLIPPSSLACVMQEETDEERGRRIAAQWTTDPAAAGAAAAAGVMSEEGVEGEGQVEGEAAALEHYSQDDFEAPDHTPPYHQYQAPTPMPAHDAAIAAVTALEAAQAALAALQKEARLIERYHLHGAAFDFGPSNVFLPLAGRCLVDAGRWHYEACFFESASQSEAGGLNKVSLGTWRGFSQDYKQVRGGQGG